MKLVYGDMEHILRFDDGYVIELVVENRKYFFKLVNSFSEQIDGGKGDAVLSLSDKPLEFSKYADITVQFAPFQVNRKSLITKLCSALEYKSIQADNYLECGEIISRIESFVQKLSTDFSFEVDCKKIAIGPIIKAISPEFDETGKTPMERIFGYMELVRELDRDKLFIMVNMRSYFSDEEMNRFTESACLHDFKVLLLESTSFAMLENTKRYVVDEDLCEF